MGGGKNDLTGFAVWLDTRNKSMTDAARACGIHRRSLIRIANGDAPLPKMDTLKALANYCEASVKTVERQLLLSATEWHSRTNLNFCPRQAKLILLQKHREKHHREILRIDTQIAQLQETT